MAVAVIFQIVLERFTGRHTVRGSDRDPARGVVFAEAKVVRRQSEVNANDKVRGSIFADRPLDDGKGCCCLIVGSRGAANMFHDMMEFYIKKQYYLLCKKLL